MDMRKVVEEHLYNLAKDEASLERMQEQITALETERSAIRAARTDGDPVSGGGNGRSEWLDNNIQQREYLALRIRAVELRVHAVREALGQLSPEQQKILDVFFIHRISRPEEYLAACLNMDRATVFRKRSWAVLDLARSLYGGIEV